MYLRDKPVMGLVRRLDQECVMEGHERVAREQAHGKLLAHHRKIQRTYYVPKNEY
jgi:hypothetical protein